ncbi:MAG TPA: hypothetical protein PKI32_06910, partial [Opitutales bacterium]|nr:hypothetical protein [Opitutales bacterium]
RALSADVGASVHTSLALGDFRFIPELKGYRTSELLNDAGNATASFAAGDAFAVPGRGAMGDGWTGEASLRIVYAERLTLGATFAKTNRRDGSADSAVFWVRSVF